MGEMISFRETNKLFITCIEDDLEKNFKGQFEIINAVNKCMKHITCLGCLDTRRILFESESFFGGTYEEFSCPACTYSRDRKDSHHQIFHCQVNGRQVPYNGGDRKVGYSRTQQLYQIYKKDYEKNDLLLEEQERKRKAAELEAETLRIENERIKKEQEEQDEKNKPQWDFMDDKNFRQEINSTDVEVNISKLVEDISKLMALSAGNLAALPSFLTGVKLTFSNYWSNESSKNSSVHRLKDAAGESVYIKFEYNKVIEESTVTVGILRTKSIVKKQFLCVSYFMAKPTKDNKNAEKICEELMNTTIQSVINKLNRQ
ncbi:MAG: hypothetical protein EBY20_01065 [Alphaproteobacteria bacterium]|uniref:Uncharacterized protein n=1 Tax=viral metagenome TaxID=1070528 RepID=A0A6C0HPI9_9ZZZZ|nr:hypothetical protein [Alphaproteobacteria bacterium]